MFAQLSSQSRETISSTLNYQLGTLTSISNGVLSKSINKTQFRAFLLAKFNVLQQVLQATQKEYEVDLSEAIKILDKKTAYLQKSQPDIFEIIPEENLRLYFISTGTSIANIKTIICNSINPTLDTLDKFLYKLFHLMSNFMPQFYFSHSEQQQNLYCKTI